MDWLLNHVNTFKGCIPLVAYLCLVMFGPILVHMGFRDCRISEEFRGRKVLGYIGLILMASGAWYLYQNADHIW